VSAMEYIFHSILGVRFPDLLARILELIVAVSRAKLRNASRTQSSRSSDEAFDIDYK